MQVKNKKIKWLDRSLIVGPFVTLVLSDKQYQKAMDHCRIAKNDRSDWIKTPTADATVHFLEDGDKDMVAVVAIRVKKQTNPNAIIGLLAHESVHIWQRFKRRIGENEPSDEFEAYSIQTITQRLIEAYSKQAKRCK